MRVRDPWLDNIRLLAIVLVVVGHALGSSKGINPDANILSTFIYLFHIPMFALAAGWTAQRLTASPAQLVKTTWQILVPYALFQSIALGIARWDGREPPWQYSSATFALWFLLALFIWRLLVPWFRGSAYGIAAALAITLLAGLVHEVGETFSLSRALFFFPAFLVGATYGDRLSGWLDRRGIRIAGWALLGLALAYCVAFADTMNRRLQLGRDDYASLGMGALDGAWARLLTIVVGIVLALACIAVVPRRRVPLTHLGAYTLYVYLLHVAIRRALLALDLLPDAHGARALVVLVVGAIAVALLLATKPVRLLTRPLVEPIWLRDLVWRRTR